MLTPRKIELFLGKIQQTPDCWLWTAGTYTSGYGMFAPETHKPQLAHRISYELWYQKPVKGKVVRHTCDNPKCVNPLHLELGTQSENMKDMALKGRSTNPSGRVRVVMTEELRKEIRNSSKTLKEMTELYGYSSGYLSDIRNGKA